MSNGFLSEQPAEKGSQRLTGIMVVLACVLGGAGFIAYRILPDATSALEADRELRQEAVAASVISIDPGVVLMSCLEVTCDEALAEFNVRREQSDEYRTYSLSRSIADRNGQVIMYVFTDARLQVVEQGESDAPEK